MKNAFFAMIFSGMLGLAGFGCGSSDSSDKGDSGGGGAGGGGGDAMGQVCDRLQSCQTVGTVMAGATTAAECKQAGSTAIGKVSVNLLPTVNQALSGCLEMTDCAQFTECMKALAVLMPTH